MKTTWLSLLMTAALAAGARAGDLPTAAGKFVERLATGDYDGAVGQCDNTMKQAAPAPKLKEIWQSLVAAGGQFERQAGVRAEKLGGYNFVFVTCQFERRTLDLKVVFDGQERVAGLFLVPTRVPAAEAPSYARTNSFEERPFTVGEGEWKLPGTLSLPKGAGPWPAVVLVHGSGPQDRDETVAANKPFRDLAWGLASRGIAVLRYEKRTREYGARLADAASRITLVEETVTDAVSAARQLRATTSIAPRRVFVLGHSLGGLAAPRIGAADPELGGLIILAGSTRPLEDLVVEQIRYLVSLQAPSDEAKAKVAEIEALMQKVKALTPADASSSELILGAGPAYWLDLRAYDAVATARKLPQPFLILQGQRDYQATEADFAGWKKGLASRPGVTFKLYPDLNHLFITGQGKSKPAEYEQPGHVAEEVITDVAAWVLATDGGAR